MSSKRITLVLGALVVIAFGYIGFMDAVRTWQNLQEQNTQIETLNTEYNKLDKELDNTAEASQQGQEEVKNLEQEKQRLEEERIKLEQELQAILGVFYA